MSEETDRDKRLYEMAMADTRRAVGTFKMIEKTLGLSPNEVHGEKGISDLKSEISDAVDSPDAHSSASCLEGGSVIGEAVDPEEKGISNFKSEISDASFRVEIKRLKAKLDAAERLAQAVLDNCDPQDAERHCEWTNLPRAAGWQAIVEAAREFQDKKG